MASHGLTYEPWELIEDLFPKPAATGRPHDTSARKAGPWNSSSGQPPQTASSGPQPFHANTPDGPYYDDSSQSPNVSLQYLEDYAHAYHDRNQ